MLPLSYSIFSVFNESVPVFRILFRRYSVCIGNFLITNLWAVKTHIASQILGISIIEAEKRSLLFGIYSGLCLNSCSNDRRFSAAIDLMKEGIFLSMFNFFTKSALCLRANHCGSREEITLYCNWGWIYFLIRIDSKTVGKCVCSLNSSL